jgi:hypothetical protein
VELLDDGIDDPALVSADEVLAEGVELLLYDGLEVVLVSAGIELPVPEALLLVAPVLLLEP